jgi:hypothetical protein
MAKVMGSILVNGSTGYLIHVITIFNSSIDNEHVLQFTVAHTESFRSVVINRIGVIEPESELSYDCWSVGQFVLVSGHHRGPATNLSFSFTEIIYRPLWIFSTGCPLWWECYWALPALSLSGPSPTEFEAIALCLIWDEVPFLSPLMTCRARVELFYFASMQGMNWSCYWSSLYNYEADQMENTVLLWLYIARCLWVFIS